MVINPDSMHSSDSAVEAFDKQIGLRSDEKILILEFFPKPPACILDLGCGNGRTTIPLYDMGYDVIGLDISKPLIKRAKNKNSEIHYIVGDVRSLGFKQNQFDGIIFSWNGIDYIYPLKTRRKVLRNIINVAKTGAIFIFSSHNALGVCSRLLTPVYQTLMALRFLKDQIPFRSYLFDWYFVWRDNALGTPVFYSAPPKIQVRILKKAGWNVISVRSQTQPAKRPIIYSDVHINYVCQKPFANF